MPTAALMPGCTAATAATTTAATTAATAAPPATTVLRAGAPAVAAVTLAAAVAPTAATATRPPLPRPMVTLGRRRARGSWLCIRHLQSNIQQVVVEVLPCRLALPLVLRILALALWAALWDTVQ